jgi:hypothetical protein
MTTNTPLMWPTLNADSQRCLTEIQVRLGRTVLFIPAPTFSNNQYGDSDLDNGIPTVWLRPVQPNLQTTIIHELHHLKLRSLGFPVCRVLVRGEADIRIPNSPQRNTFLNELPNKIQATIEHFNIYRMMNNDFPSYDPVDDLRRDMTTILTNGSRIGGPEPTLALWRRALVFFQCGVELEGDPLLPVIADWFRINGWNRELRLGKNLCAEVRRIYPLSRGEMVKCVSRCLSVLLRGYNRFHFIGSYKEGRKRIAVIGMIPFDGA